MTPDRLRECLALLHWSQRGLAEILYCDDRLSGAGPKAASPCRVDSRLAGKAGGHV